MLVSVHTANEAAVTVTLMDCPDMVHKCVGVSVGQSAITKMDSVTARSLLAGLDALVSEVEQRNDEIKGDTNG